MFNSKDRSFTSVTRIYTVAAVVAGDVFRRNRSGHRFSPNYPKIPKTNGQAEEFWAPVPRAGVGVAPREARAHGRIEGRRVEAARNVEERRVGAGLGVLLHGADDRLRRGPLPAPARKKRRAPPWRSSGAPSQGLNAPPHALALAGWDPRQAKGDEAGAL